MATKKDLYLDPDTGDIAIGSNGDLKVAYDDDVTVQDVMFRLRTYKGDYGYRVSCGASVEDFIGKPNTRETGDALRAQLTNALIYDRLLSPSSFTIEVVPLNEHTLAALIEVTGIRGTFTVASSLDLTTGDLQVIPS